MNEHMERDVVASIERLREDVIGLIDVLLHGADTGNHSSRAYVVQTLQEVSNRLGAVEVEFARAPTGGCD